MGLLVWPVALAHFSRGFSMKQLSTPIETIFQERSVAAWEGGGFRAGLFTFQGIVRLSIWRLGGGDSPMSWEELQKVKSDCGFGDWEAVEVYPRDSEVINTANARHLYLTETPLHFAMRIPRPGLKVNNPGGLNG